MDHYVMTVLAVLPAAVLLWFIYKEDKVEKEPIALLAKIFVCGVLSTAIACVLEYAGQMILLLLFNGDFNNILCILILNFLVVGLSEEFVKYMAVKIVAWKDKDFNYTFDAVVYCVTASLGFAALENIKYLWDAPYESAALRGVLSVPGHAIFAVFMGMYMGFAKYCEGQGNIRAMKNNLFKALFVPMLVHGFFDFILSFEGILPKIIFFAFEITIVVVAFKKIKFLSSGDTAIFQNYYAYLWETRKNAQKEQIRQMQYNQQMQQMYGQLPGMQNTMGNQNPQLGAQQGQYNYQISQNNNFQQAQNMNWQPAANAYQQQVMQNKNLSAQPVNTYNPAQQPTANWQPNQNVNFQQAQTQPQAQNPGQGMGPRA
ncbi:PrsW family intramembrane metalloprotease [Butyrivibrio sp. MC2021]|uniref:PrsW family intramembrane metalloprotease n=1 Tax=Butyrivibrio sp. MC2021 TaxID=1408306 RepID=UPI00047BA523|nr:PrsW family glutamic-type intramembrane protease [Butyrivibrio sp. MC2021]